MSPRSAPRPTRGFFQRFIDLVAETSSRDGIEHDGKREQDERERRSVPEREPDAKGHQSTFSMYPLPRMVWISFLGASAIDLIAEIIDIDVDDIGERIEILVPDMVGNHRDGSTLGLYGA